MKIRNTVVFRFLQVDIEGPDNKLEQFPELQSDDKVFIHVKEFREKTTRHKVAITKKLLAFTKAQKIMLYNPFLEWYLTDNLKNKVAHKFL